jgi:uncharacterized protein
MRVRNPFIISGYKGPAYFCDREKEAEQLKRYIDNQVNISLFAYRRLGKTGLIHHVFHKLKKNKDLSYIYIDILSTTNLNDFTNRLATAIYNTFPPNSGIGKKIIKAIQSLRPAITFDDLSGMPSLSFNIQTPDQREKTIHELFAFIDKQAKQVVFAIDEFQQILEYPEKNVEALLRTQMQELKQSSFIFSGSNQKMMHEIFNSAKRPFFASCTPMHLDYIPLEKYESFISSVFKKHNRQISAEAVKFICNWTKLHTYYTQYLCNFIFSKNITDITKEETLNASIEILEIHENIFYQYRNLLTATQWRLLKGIAKREQLYKPNSKSFISESEMGTASVVNRALSALLEKEMIFYNTMVEKPYYEVYNKFLMRWLQRQI